MNGQGRTQEFFFGGGGQIFYNKLEHRKQGRGAQLKIFAFLDLKLSDLVHIWGEF